MRRAIILMNLGGPDSPAAIRPFLYNLFSDPAIITLPTALRLPLAGLISWRRSPTAQAIYAQLGGVSPLLENTLAQAAALEAVLGGEDRCFVAMRYWHPLAAETVRAVMEWEPDRLVLLPLYQQYSTTTTGSSLTDWYRATAAEGLALPTRIVHSYPDVPGFIAALKGAIVPYLDRDSPQRLLFSAHGLPLRIVAKGDPYPQEIERTALAVVAALARSGLDWRICYQSRVGPLKWLGPSVEEELHRAAQDQVGVVITPISFVSEHSETLVELDRDYRRIAETIGVPGYERVPTVGTDPNFIAALAALVGEPDAEAERIAAIAESGR
jgi:ferrochelatase